MLDANVPYERLIQKLHLKSKDVLLLLLLIKQPLRLVRMKLPTVVAPFKRAAHRVRYSTVCKVSQECETDNHAPLFFFFFLLKSELIKTIKGHQDLFCSFLHITISLFFPFW